MGRIPRSRCPLITLISSPATIAARLFPRCRLSPLL